MTGASFLVSATLASVLYILRKRQRAGRKELVNETDHVNNEIRVTADDQSRAENGALNPACVAGNEETPDQRPPDTGVKGPEQNMAGADQSKSESSC